MRFINGIRNSVGVAESVLQNVRVSLLLLPQLTLHQLAKPNIAFANQIISEQLGRFAVFLLDTQFPGIIIVISVVVFGVPDKRARIGPLLLAND